MRLNKFLYLIITRNRRRLFGRFIAKVVHWLYYALENKNNDHHTNGEFWLMEKLNAAGFRTIFDVGANVGKWSLEAIGKFPHGRIYSFEPVPDVYATLVANVSKNERIKTFNYALSDASQTLTFNVYANSTLFSSLYSHHMGKDSVAVEVEGIDGDTFCDKEGVDKIDFLKLDAEGSEPMILKGFAKMLSAKKIRVIQFEYGVLSIESKFLLKDYYTLFEKYGYKLGKIYPNHVDFSPYSWEKENFIGPNYVAIADNEAQLFRALQ